MGQGEVEALQGLAAAHGGMLTTNPQTGLPEAGFLSKILPLVAGAAGAVAAPFTGGIINPLTTSLLVGGITGAATGNIKKGLLAGLGAYGGFGLAGSLGAAGAASGASAGSIGNIADAGAKFGEAAGAVPLGGGLNATPALTETLPTAAGNATKDFLIPTATTSGGNTAAFSLAPDAAPLTYNTGAASQYNLLGGSKAVLGAPSAAMSPMDKLYAIGRGATPENLMNYASNNKLATAAAFAPVIAGAMEAPKEKEIPEDTDPGQRYRYAANPTQPTPDYDPQGRERRYFNPRYVNAARGGIMQGVSPSESHLGSYSAGGRGRLLRGPGDGVSDSIPATIGGKQPARLADGEFVIPARIVSELGNGSTEAGAKQLYAMMDRIQRARRKTTGKNKVAVNTKARKLMPA
jgi:hypothetical protein